MKNDKKPTARSNGGHARAQKLSPARRKAIATKAAKIRWGNKVIIPKLDTSMTPARSNWREITRQDGEERLKREKATLRDKIAQSVLNGLYANIDVAQKFAAHVMGQDMLLPEAFTRIAYAQADEAIRLRSL